MTCHMNPANCFRNAQCVAHHDSSTMYPSYMNRLPFYQHSYFSEHGQSQFGGQQPHHSYFSEHGQSQFGGQQPHPQWQGHMHNMLQVQQRHDCCSLFPWNSSPPSSAIGLSESSPRIAQATAMDTSSSSANACGLAANLAYQQPHVQQPNRPVNRGTGKGTYYSKELKREFCLFQRNWMAARTDGTRCDPWRSAHLAFFRSKIQFFEGSIPTDRSTRTWWSQRHKYLTGEENSTCVEGAFADDSAADAEALDAPPHHEAQVQAQSPASEYPSSVVSRAADAAAAAAVNAAWDHASPVAAAMAEGARIQAAIAAATTGAVL